MTEDVGVDDIDSISQARPWLNRIWGTTFGTATLYLKKPVLPPVSEYRNLLMRRGPVDAGDDEAQRGAVDYHHHNRHTDSGVPYHESRGHCHWLWCEIMDWLLGSEVRLLRRVRIWEKGNLKSCPIDFGVGAKVTLDPEVKLKPVARIRVADAVTMKFAPEPVMKFSKTLPFHFQGMQAHLRYEVPLTGLRESWWKPPARMLVRFEHGSNSGFHFYPGGLEFGDHTIPLTENSTSVLRVAAGLSFPREYPMHPDNQAKWEIYRLGLKTVW